MEHFNIYYNVDNDTRMSKIKMEDFLRFHDKEGYTNAPKYYVTLTLPLLYLIRPFFLLCLTNMSLFHPIL